MPFMKGQAAYRNTLQYLQQGKIVFKHDVRAMLINYNMPIRRVAQQYKEDTSSGIRGMVYWHLNQIQYKNPQTQIVTLKNMTPSPFMTFILGNGSKFQVDVEGKTKEEILAHLRTIIGKTDEDLQEEEPLVDLSTFGAHSERWCMCEVPGQVPCPAYVPLPKELTGKYRRALALGEVEPN